MAFFDNIGDVLSNKGKEAADAAKKLAEIANLKAQIANGEAEVRKNYRKLGEAYYNAYKDSEVTCEFEEQIQAVRDAAKAVAELQKKVNTLRGGMECSQCNAVIPVDSAFCPKCGHKIEKDFFDEEDTVVDDTVVEDTIVEEAATETVEETTSETHTTGTYTTEGYTTDTYTTNNFTTGSYTEDILSEEIEDIL